MAEGVLKKAEKKLEEHLNCPICLDTYTDPKQLQCNHVYCRQCLVPLVVQDQQGKLGLTCPACRQVTPIPDRGVAGLQPAFHINRLLEIQESFQVLEIQAATPEEVVSGATSNAPVPPRSSLKHCIEHPEEEVKLHCETCGELVCVQCIMKGGKHHDHEYVLLKKAFAKYKEEITPSLEPMEKQVDIAMKALSQLDTRCGEISDQRAATEDSIHETCRRLRDAVNVREAQLINQLDQMTWEKLKGLAVQRDQIETTLAQLCSCLRLMKKSLRHENEDDALMMKSNTIEQIHELTVPFKEDILKPSTEADIVFSAPQNVSAVCQDFGQVLLSKYLPDPSKCRVTGRGLEVAVAEEESTVVLEAINFVGESCKVPIRLLECEVVSEITGTRANCTVERRGQSRYEISYQPTIMGKYQLHIKAECQHIRGSPFTVAVKASIKKLGTPISTICGLKSPWGCAINHSGEVFVTDQNSHCVAVFTLGGQKLRSFGIYGNPYGLTLDGEGNILVADFLNNRIQKFTTKGKFLAAVGTRGSGPLQFYCPTDIGFNARNGKFYVADNGNHCIQILNSDLSTSVSFGKKGSGKGCFNCPYSVTFDSTGNVYVADSGNHCIQVFTPEGKFLRMFGRHGRGKGELNSPIGLAIDASDMVYVSEDDNHRVSIFTSDGQFASSFGRNGKRPGEFLRPRGLAVDDRGVVYVCDGENKHVQAFS